MDIIVYNLKLKEGEEYTFTVDIDREDSIEASCRKTHPFWTYLNYNQCSNCPLQTSIHKHCPAALDLEEIAEKFGNIISTERADVWVQTKNRTFFKNCDVQEALKSIFGLIMASGNCPILSRLKPLAYFHLPFADIEETVHRLVGTYLIKQYFNSVNGKCEPDWNLKGIETLYKELETVNVHFMHRLQDASTKDASSNALYIFVTLTSLISMDINKMLEALKPIVNNGL